MRLSSLQTILSSVGGLFARPKEMHARARIDPETAVSRIEGADVSEPPLAIGVRLANPRSEVIVSREAIHE